MTDTDIIIEADSISIANGGGGIRATYDGIAANDIVSASNNDNAATHNATHSAAGSAPSATENTASPAATNNTTPESSEQNDPDYNLFVATVYAEATFSSSLTYEGKTYYGIDALNNRIPNAVIEHGKISWHNYSSEAAWKGVASVIMNRVGKGQWAAYTTPKAVIE